MPDEPSERDKEMRELGYTPASILDQDGAIAVCYYVKTWSQPVMLNEFPSGDSARRASDFRPWAPPRRASSSWSSGGHRGAGVIRRCRTG